MSPINLQGDQLSRKPENVREFDSWQGNVRYFTKSQGRVGRKILLGKRGLNCLLLADNILEFAELVHLILVLDHALFVSFLPPPLTITLVPA